MNRTQAIASDNDACRYVSDLIYERTRIQLHQGKEALIQGRLARRVRHHGYDSLAEYCEYLRTSADEREFTAVVDSLTTNHTNFFREADHFEFLVRTAVPGVLGPGSKRFRIWSAASSTGEEAYTVAMFLAEHFPPAQGWDWRIHGTDVSTRVLETARQGVYSEDRVHTVPAEWLRRYFQKGVGRWSGFFRIKRALAERVTFQHLNLVATYDLGAPFEVIFCRNVMIYFDRPTQEQLVQQLCRFLVPGGHLLIGHSESLNGMNLPLRCLRPSIYQRL